MDLEAKKKVLRKLTYGLYVATASDGGDVATATVNWLSQASFSPTLIMVGLKADGHLHAVVERTGSFAVNVLGAGQKDLAGAFFAPVRVENGRLAGYAFEKGPETGAPLLIDAPAWFEAKVTDTVKRGDHTVFVAEVVSVGLRDPDAKPLELSDTGWSYGG